MTTQLQYWSRKRIKYKNINFLLCLSIISEAVREWYNMEKHNNMSMKILIACIILANGLKGFFFKLKHEKLYLHLDTYISTSSRIYYHPYEFQIYGLKIKIIVQSGPLAKFRTVTLYRTQSHKHSVLDMFINSIFIVLVFPLWLLT